LIEKIGKIAFVLSRAFHFAIVLLVFEAFFWLSRWIWSIGWLQIILFHLEYRYEGKLLILQQILDSISASYLRKAHFVSNMGGFLITQPSLAQGAFCRSIFSPKLPILVIILLMALVSLLLVWFSDNYGSLVSKFCLSLSYGWVSILLAHFNANLY
jgi:hypothetical protein